MLDDLELLRTYAAEGSDDAFRTILERHLGLVYSAALRQVRDPHLAEEVTQAVFVVLARKAGSLSSGTMLAGWLFRTTRFVAARAVRDRQLRQLREQEAAHMEHCLSAPSNDVAWEDVAPALDEAMARLGETDRHAVLLRFFEKKELKEVGHALGSSEDAAKKRVSRALDKLRTFLVRRGIMLSTATLAGVLVENSVHAAPAALSASTLAVVTAQAGTATTIALVQGAIKAMFYAKLKMGALAATVLLAVVGGGFGMTSLFKPKQKTQVQKAQFITGSLEKFDGKLFASYAPGSSDWTLVPIGNLNFGGVPFQLTTKLQLQGNSDSKDGRYYPSRVMGMPVHERLARLHLLHTANIPGTEGRPVAALRLNYAGGKTHTLFVVYGVHTRDWWKYSVERISVVTDTNTRRSNGPRSKIDPIWRSSFVNTQRGNPQANNMKTSSPFLSAQKLRRVLAAISVVLLLSGACIQAAQTLVPLGAIWRYRDLGIDQGTAWRQVNFNDSAWGSGPSQLGFGDADEMTMINIGPAGMRYPTIYFRHTFVVTNFQALTNLAVRLMRDDGGVVYLNGVEVFRSNMPDDPPQYMTLATSTASGSDESAFYTSPVPLTPVRSGTNVIAVEIHQADIRTPNRRTSTGTTLVFIHSV